MNFATYSLWSGYGTIAVFLVTLLAFILKWGWRFRLVGATGFMGVLTAGLFALSLGLLERADVEGAVAFNRVYDNGANQIVITVPVTVTPQQLEATLLKASHTYFSFGRGSQKGNKQLLIRARTLIHPQTGQSKPLYLGQLQSPLGVKGDEQVTISLDKKAFAQLVRAVPQS